MRLGHQPLQARSAYIHVPFCRHRCGYCNFTLVAGRDDWIDRYLNAISTELSWLETPRPVDTLFLGGGTPTHLPPDQLRRLLSQVTEWFPLETGGEFSVEANPRDLLDESRTAVLREFGVSRLSLGVQSFQVRKLRYLERDHTPDEVIAVLRALRDWIHSLSIDLIFGVPGEEASEWQLDLTCALDLPIDHVSTYGLTIEKGTMFFNRQQHGQLQEIDEDHFADFYETAIDRLSSAGFEHYEVSNFARSGHRCRHNEVYWAGAPFFGIGPGAASYTGQSRSINHRSTARYLDLLAERHDPVAETETLTDEDRARERLVIGLRRMEGWDLNQFESETGYTAYGLAGPMIDQFVAQGLLALDRGRLKLTRKGLLVSDSLWPELLSSPGT